MTGRAMIDIAKIHFFGKNRENRWRVMQIEHKSYFWGVLSTMIRQPCLLVCNCLALTFIG